MCACVRVCVGLSSLSSSSFGPPLAGYRLSCSYCVCSLSLSLCRPYTGSASAGSGIVQWMSLAVQL